MNQTNETMPRDGHDTVSALKSDINRTVNAARQMLENHEYPTPYETRIGARPHESGEGEVTKTIESATSKIPSGAFLSFALGAIGLSAILQATGRKQDAQFVGQWVPTVLLLGLYNKVVKLHGSE